MAQPPDYEAPPGTPRWVKIFGIIAVVVIVLLMILLLVGGDHGPGRHTGSSDTGIPPAEMVQRMSSR